MTWILIIFIHAGVLSPKDSMAITNVPGFATEQACMAAGRKSEELGRGNTKEVKFVCVRSN